MILLSNMNAQTLQPGQALTFDIVRKSKNGCECFNAQAPTSVKLCGRGTYDVSFSGNITGAAAAALQIAIATGTTPLRETGMNSVPAAEGDLNNVSTRTLVGNNCCDLNRLSIINSGLVPVTIAPGSAFVIIRKSGQ